MRVDTGPDSGLGHVRRCLVLAGELGRRGLDCSFLVPGPEGAAYVSGAGHEALSLGAEEHDDLRSVAEYVDRRHPAAVVIDSYLASNVDELQLNVPVIVLDDLADRYLPVSIVVNAAAHAPDLKYAVAERTQLLLGTEYALLETQYANLPDRTASGRVLVTLGGGDSDGLTVRIVDCLVGLLGGARFDVVVGPFFPPSVIASLEDVSRSNGGVRLHRDVTDLRPLYAASELVITGGGQTLLEAAATGAACLAIKLAPNQRPNIEGLAASGAIVDAGESAGNDLPDRLGRIVPDLWSNPAERERLGAAARQRLDGRGAERIADAVCEVLG